MGIPLDTAGVTVGYAVETETKTRPITGYIKIPDIKETAELDATPTALDTTVLTATEYKTSKAGLKDLGGVKDFKALYTEELETVWDKCVGTYETLTEGKQMWFEIKHPKLAKSVYFKGQPAKMGLPAMGVDQVLETNLHIAILSEPERAEKSTDA